jgi:hypothetical protein
MKVYVVTCSGLSHKFLALEQAIDFIKFTVCHYREITLTIIEELIC